MLDIETPAGATQSSFRSELVQAGHLILTDVRGVYGLGATCERVIERFQRLVTTAGAELEPEVAYFPPVLGRDSYRRADHLNTMPHLLGSVHGFTGGEAEYAEMRRRAHGGEDWAACLAPTNVVIAPAACYSVYPSATGTLPHGGRTVDIVGTVFRREPSDDPTRMQCFRMREYVRLGTPEQALAHRDGWIARARELLSGLGLEVTVALANDPFFGRAGRVMKEMQREQSLKYELTCPITTREAPTAVASCNYHLDHFARAFDIRTADSQFAHTACVGFGLERIALALFRAHGMDPARWPEDVRSRLALD